MLRPESQTFLGALADPFLAFPCRRTRGSGTMSEIAGLAVLRATGAVVHMWAIRGRVLAMSDHPDVPSARSGAFSGTVWLQDDGRIAAVTSSRQRPPDGFAGAHGRRRRALAGHARA